VTEPDEDPVSEAAEAVVASRRVLTAATRRVDQLSQEHQGGPTSPEADRVERDHQLAQAAHRLALERLRQALVEDRLRAPIPGDVTERLRMHLASKGGTDELRAIKTAGSKVGHSGAALRTAVPGTGFREVPRAVVTVRPSARWRSIAPNKDLPQQYRSNYQDQECNQEDQRLPAASDGLRL
jgi:hypothetical protein